MGNDIRISTERHILATISCLSQRALGARTTTSQPTATPRHDLILVTGSPSKQRRMPRTPPSSPDRTVLFADLVGSTQLYERAGDSYAFKLVDRSLRAIRRAIESNSGDVIKHTGDGLMAVFMQADHAADAAIGMHALLKELPTSGGPSLAVRTGFHFGPVIESGNDVFGETVNFAARLAELASPGRALTSAETLQQLSMEWRALLQPLPPRILRGASRPIDIYELKCEAMGDVTLVQNAPFELPGESELRLYLNEQSLVINEQNPVARLGRDAGSDLRVGDNRASRRHADIELRGEKFVLVDRSSNGTYIAIDGEKEFFLCREEAVLKGQGRIALGDTCAGNPYAVSFVCI